MLRLLLGQCLLPQQSVMECRPHAALQARRDGLTLLSLEQLLPPGQRVLPQAVHHWLGAGLYGIMVPVTPDQLRRHSHLPGRLPMEACAKSSAQQLNRSQVDCAALPGGPGICSSSMHLQSCRPVRHQFNLTPASPEADTRDGVVQTTSVT